MNPSNSAAQSTADSFEQVQEIFISSFKQIYELFQIRLGREQKGESRNLLIPVMVSPSFILLFPIIF